MDFKVLVDNSCGPDGDLLAEHGLSFYFEADGFKWLLDVGASDRFALNAERMGISIAEVDHLILSHAHADHTGGLAAFLQRNDHASIWLSSHMDGRHFYSTRRGGRRDISVDYALLERFPDRFHFVSENRQLTPSVALMTEIPDVFPRPRANSTLYADELPDDFNHELAVLVREPDGMTVCSSCSHKGILNTLMGARYLVREGKFFQPVPILAYVGGLHLVESDAAHQFETPAEVEEIARQVLSDYPGLTVYTGHCTGAAPLELLRHVLGTRLVHFHTGFDSRHLH